MKDLIISKYPSYYLIPGIHVVPFKLSRSLSKWDKVYFKMKEIGYCFDEQKHEVRIPAGYPEDGIKALFPEYTIVDCPVKTHDDIKIQLMNPPRDYIQTTMFAFMTGAEPYPQMKNKSQQYITLDTGLGKTFLGIAATCFYKSRAVIITPAITKIMNQWMDSISNFTTLKRTEYLLVRGSDMCVDIIAGKYENVKMFVIPRSTILSFEKTFNDPNAITTLFDAMNADIKIVDEAHMDFHTVVKIDCYTNIAKTYYMSSSPSRSDTDEKKIYYRVFKSVPQYGKELLTKEQHHIVPLIIQFKSRPSMEQIKKIKTPYGPSLALYGDYLLDEDGARDEFLDAYTYAVYQLLKFRRRGGKILVICITVEFAKKLKEYTMQVFPYLSTGLYVGSSKNKDDELKNDIIFSTTKSMGTGSEISNHQLTINTITYSSDIMADQIPGRIRSQTDRKGIYCEIVNMAHPVAKDHYLKRESYLKKKAKDGKILIHELNQGDISEMNRFLNKGYRFNENGLIIFKGKIEMHRKR